MNIDDIKDKTIKISLGTWIASIIIAMSITTAFWNFTTLESRVDKRYIRHTEQIEDMDGRIKALEKVKK